MLCLRNIAKSIILTQVPLQKYQTENAARLPPLFCILRTQIQRDFCRESLVTQGRTTEGNGSRSEAPRSALPRGRRLPGAAVEEGVLRVVPPPLLDPPGAR